VSPLGGLPGRGLQRDRQVAGRPLARGRKREHVGRLVLAAVFEVQGAQRSVARQQHADHGCNHAAERNAAIHGGHGAAAQPRFHGFGRKRDQVRQRAAQPQAGQRPHDHKHREARHLRGGDGEQAEQARGNDEHALAANQADRKSAQHRAGQRAERAGAERETHLRNREPEFVRHARRRHAHRLQVQSFEQGQGEAQAERGRRRASLRNVSVHLVS